MSSGSWNSHRRRLERITAGMRETGEKRPELMRIVAGEEAPVEEWARAAAREHSSKSPPPPESASYEVQAEHARRLCMFVRAEVCARLAEQRGESVPRRWTARPPLPPLEFSLRAMAATLDHLDMNVPEAWCDVREQGGETVERIIREHDLTRTGGDADA